MKKALRPPEKQDAIGYLIDEHQLSVKRSCTCVSLSRAAYYRTPKGRDDFDVIDAINGVIEKRARWGFWKTCKALGRKGYRWNHKQIYRVYCQLNLNQKWRARKRIPQRPALPLSLPAAPNRAWSADFMSDALYVGKRFRTFNVLDDFSREILAIEIDTSLTGNRLIRVFEQLQNERGYRKSSG